MADEDADATETTATADLESILGMFCTCGGPERMLRWHYRSRHESLIAVSNHEFYDNRLVLFPSPDAQREETGLHFRHDAGTCYERGNRKRFNAGEAGIVAEAVMEHAQRRPNLTLGVAAFNLSQARRIVSSATALPTTARDRPATETASANRSSKVLAGQSTASGAPTGSCTRSVKSKGSTRRSDVPDRESICPPPVRNSRLPFPSSVSTTVSRRRDGMNAYGLTTSPHRTFNQPFSSIPTRWRTRRCWNRSGRSFRWRVQSMSKRLRSGSRTPPASSGPEHAFGPVSEIWLTGQGPGVCSA